MFANAKDTLPENPPPVNPVPAITPVILPPPLPPAIDSITIAPLLFVNTMLFPATKLAEITVFDGLLVTVIPLPATTLLALPNKVLKLVFILPKAVYKLSLPVLSLGRPMLIDKFPEIAII